MSEKIVARNPIVFADAFRNLALFTAPRPILEAIALTPTASGVRLTATNSYLLATCEVAADVCDLAADESLLIPAKPAATFARHAKRVDHLEFAHTSHDTGGGDWAATLVGAGGTVTVDRERGDFPRWRNLWPVPAPEYLAGALAFGPKYLALFAKIVVDGKTATATPVRFWATDSTNPVVFECGPVSGIMMPVRLDETGAPSAPAAAAVTQ